ncbi:hypothetical protein VTN31DRAFT_765 [Thermomyces dupontii]|uniref:uncharacterized protein n=1 Tax=Talaromyces thermophilus TaxID=28565 RepID=UPI00374241D7
MSFPNVYHLRRVADTASKACFICYKPSSSVLITPDNKDWFYVCPVHLQDRNFCSPLDNSSGSTAAAEAEARRARDEALKLEIEKVKKEYEEKQRRKKEKEKQSTEKDEGEGANKDRKGENQNKEENVDFKKTAEKDLESASPLQKADTQSEKPAGPRIFALHKTFYQMRITRQRNIEMARRSAERLEDASLFPSVPKGDIS